MKSSLPSNPETCPRCYVGRIKPQPMTLATMVSGKLLSIPNFPAWVCDVCHAYIYDPNALAQLHAVLNAPKHKTTANQNITSPVKAARSRKASKANTLPG